MWIVGKNNNVLRLSLISSYGTPINAIYFGDIESFFDYIRQRFGTDALEAAQRGRFNNIVLSVVYSPKINVSGKMSHCSLKYSIISDIIF